MEHMSLTLFSICLQAAVGIMVFAAIGKLLNKDAIFKNAMMAAAGLGIIGMLASLLHLGRPLVAFMAIYQVGSSWLSREILFTALFVGLTVLAVLLLLVKPQSKGAITGATLAAAVVGLVEIGFMAAVYSSSSVPLWQGTATFVEFYAAAISMGAIIFLFLSIQEAAGMKKLLAGAVAAAVMVQVAAVVPNLINLGSNSGVAIQNSLGILSSMAAVSVFQWLFILAGAVLVVWAAKDELSPSVTNTILGSAVLLLVGQAVARYLFFAAMVVTGIGIS